MTRPELNELWTGPGFLWREMPGIRERASSKEKKNVAPKQGNESKKQRRIIVQSIKIKGIRSNDSEIFYVPEWNKTLCTPVKLNLFATFSTQTETGLDADLGGKI